MQSIDRKLICWFCAVMAGLGSCFASSITLANPSTDDPSAAIKPHGTIDGSKQRVAQMYAKFDEWETMAAEHFETMKQRGKIPHAKLSSVFADLYKGIWYSQNLASMGEPAGKDLESKFRALRIEFRKFASVLTPFQQKKVLELKKLTPKRVKSLAQINQMVQAGKITEAATAIQKLHLSQLPSIFYLTNTQASEFESPVGGLHNQILSLLAKQQKERYRKQAEAKLSQHKESIERLASEGKRVVEELEANASAVLADGQSGDAADAIAYISTLWGNANTAINRSFGIALAYQSGSPVEIDDFLESDLSRCKSIAMGAIERVLATMAKTNAEDMVSVYPRVLSQLSVLDRRYYGNLQKELQQRLESLPRQNSDLAGFAKRYSQATAEPTRWMRRFASKQLANKTSGIPEVATLLNAEFPPNHETRPAFYPRSSSRKRVLATPQLGQPASWSAGLAKSLVGKQVRQSETLRMMPDRELFVSPQTSRHYVNVNGSLDITKEVAFVEDSLLVDSDHAPLDWPSADAISATRLHEFAMVGGAVKRLSMESLVSRIATLPDVASELVPLDMMADVESKVPHFDRAIWRVDVTPEWVAHPLFVATAP